MPTVKEILAELKKLGSEQTKKTFLRHGAKEPFFGVKVGDLKKIHKRLKTNHPLALELYATGNSDAMYLAGFIADPKLMSKADLHRWVESAPWYMISEYTVAWVAAESQHGRDVAIEWILSKNEAIASAGWATYSNLVGLKQDEEIDHKEVQKLMNQVKSKILKSENRVRYAMNAFVIAVGSYVVPLHEEALKVAESIGIVEVDMGDTACHVPLATEYIQKVKAAGRVGKKRKTAFC